MVPLTKRFPLIFGETGETYNASSCADAYISRFLDWADANGVGYEAWTWDTWGGCGVLVKNYDGAPSSAWATWVKKHYLSLP
jgi:endoglucanase